MLRVGLPGGQEMPPAAAEHHVGEMAFRQVHELGGDVHAAQRGGFGRHRSIVLPVAVGRARIGGGRGGVGNAGAGDHARAHAGIAGQLEHAGQAALLQPAAVAARQRLVDVDHAGAGLHPSRHRRHRPGRIRGLHVGVVGAREGGVREVLPAQQVVLAASTGALALQDPGRCHRGQVHAVAHEQDHVAGGAGHRAAFGRSRRAAAEPPLRVFAVRPHDLRHLHGRGGGGGRWRGRAGFVRGRGAGGEQGGEAAGEGKAHGILTDW